MISRRNFLRSLLVTGAGLYVPCKFSWPKLSDSPGIKIPLLTVSELPIGALARYERDIQSIARVIARRNGKTEMICEIMCKKLEQET